MQNARVAAAPLRGQITGSGLSTDQVVQRAAAQAVRYEDKIKTQANALDALLRYREFVVYKGLLDEFDLWLAQRESAIKEHPSNPQER